MSEVQERVVKVGFTVDGEWLADFARTRLEEGRWDAGLNLLVDSLEGMTHEQAIAILKGEATLTGNSGSPKGINYKKLSPNGKTAKRMREIMDFMYGDLFRISDKIWRPYAVVSGWCADDWHFAMKFQGTAILQNIREDKYLAGRRSLYYAKNPNRDMLVRVAERFVGDRVLSDVLCEEFTGSVPFWYKIPTNIDIEKFVEEVIHTRGVGFRGLEWRGACVDHLYETISMSSSEEPKKTLVDAAELVESLPPAASQETAVEQAMVEDEGRHLMLESIRLAEDFFKEEPNSYTELAKNDRLFEGAVDRLHRHLNETEWKRVDALRDLFKSHRERILREEVIEQATVNGGFLKLDLHTYEDDKKIPFNPPFIHVPKNPFLHWCLRFFNWEDHGHETPRWEFVAGSGLKMMNDDPYHTDWVLGAGIPLDQVYDHDDQSLGAVAMSCAHELRSKIVQEYTRHQFVTLSKNDQRIFSGDIVHPEPNERVPSGSIAIVPHAGPEYQLAMETANGIDPETGRRGCIICDTGGKLAHLAVVGREFKCTVLMLPNATKMYRERDCIWIDMSNGTITHTGV